MILLSSSARTMLMEFTGKQNTKNIRYLGDSNEFTIYKKGLKDLAFTTNFKAFEIVTSDDYNEYTTSKVNEADHLIWQIPMPHNYLTPSKNGNIYLFRSEKQQVINLGKGVAPQSFDNGKYIQFYDQRKRIIEVLKFPENIKILSIRLNSRRPYYQPQVIIHNNELFYTDLNDKKIEGILRINLKDKNRSIVTRASSTSKRFTLCLNDKIIAMESDLLSNSTSFSLYKEDTFTEIFSANIGPSHSLICELSNDNVFFVSRIQGATKKISEVVEFDLKTKKLIKRSDLKFVSNISILNNQLIIPYRDKFYMIKNSTGKYVIKEALNE